MFAEKTTDDRVTIAEGTFETVDAEDGWADLVVIAQVKPVPVACSEFGVELVDRRSTGALITKRLHKNLLGSSNPKAR